ncbi:MAG: CoA ester lyase [Parvibaculaceae bacterium]
MQIRPRRSVLYMPGANERALEKAKTLPADALILDLEDSVAPDVKPQARVNVCNAVKSRSYGPREIVIRVNAIDTPWGIDDIKAAAEAGPDAILVPKVARPGDIVSAAKILGGAGAPERTRTWAMMETPLSIFNVREIASVHPAARLACLVLGTNDLLKESRASAQGGRFAIIPWLAMTILAARAYGLDVLDGVYNDFRDDQGFRAECEQGRTLGMDGKTLIHPSQLGPCNQIFSPAPGEVDWSRKVIGAFDQPENARKGVITVEGRMVERLHLDMARRTVAIAEAIAKLSEAE